MLRYVYHSTDMYLSYGDRQHSSCVYKVTDLLMSLSFLGYVGPAAVYSTPQAGIMKYSLVINLNILQTALHEHCRLWTVAVIHAC